MKFLNRVKCATFALFCTVAAPVTAQELLPCDWQTSARNLIEPWEDNTRTFANGDVRIAALDTIEPAVGFAYLMILSPPYDALGGRQCAAIGHTGGMGFAGMAFDTLQSGYEPGQGLTLKLQVTVFEPADGDFSQQSLEIIVNQASGAITASLAADSK